MFKIILKKEYDQLKKDQQRFFDMQIRVAEMHRWFSFWTPLNPLLTFIIFGRHQIQYVRKEFRNAAKSFDWGKDDGGV